MGLGHDLKLDDIQQPHHLAETIAEIDVLRHRLNKTAKSQHSVADEICRLTLENNELKLYIAAVYRLLVDKQIVSIDDLQSIVDTIDREDGVEDGRRNGPVLAL